jgi:Orange carotenoid protein, N-terminal
MPFTIDSARGIFPGTLAADAVPATIARFNQLSAEDQLALIWFAYEDMGKAITVAAPGAASMILAQGLLNKIKAMSFAEQSQAMCDLANRTDNEVCRAFGTSWVNGWPKELWLLFPKATSFRPTPPPCSKQFAT